MDISCEELISAVSESMKSLRYSPTTFYHFTKHWQALLEYMKSNNLDSFSEEAAADFFQNTFGLPIYDLPRGCKRELIDCRRALILLKEYQDNGQLCRKVAGLRHRLPDCYHSIITEFQQHLSESKSPKTMKGVLRITKTFLEFLYSTDFSALDQITSQHIANFWKGQTLLSHTTQENAAYALRKFFNFLHERGYSSLNYAEYLPKVHGNRKGHIPSFYTADEIISILKMVDRSSPVGKRDYAMMLLAIRYGMRIGDIKNLKFSSFKWREAKIAFTQSKTGVDMTLPLLPEVATAVIDYLKNGRPSTDCKFLFVRHCAPYDEFAKGNTLYNTISRYITMAGLDHHRRKRGFHSLRHSVAGNMLNQGVPLPTIAGVIGHASTESTMIYTKIGTEQLSLCALEVD